MAPLLWYFPAMGRRPNKVDRPHRERAVALGERLRRIRETQGFSREAVAHNSAVSLNTLRNIECGQTVDPSYFVIEAVALTLGVELSSLLTPPDSPRALPAHPSA